MMKRYTNTYEIFRRDGDEFSDSQTFCFDYGSIKLVKSSIKR